MEGHSAPGFAQHLGTQDHCSVRRRDVLHSAGNIPAIAALVAVYGLFSDPATLTIHLEKLSGLLPGGAIDVIRDELTGSHPSVAARSG
ncbi:MULTISPECIES: hypothetical protein [unclassified Bradyrhizobium]|uniref:hypothetical protein n=1 Tax=unclassified Bradyrhizobium TaxID=2631580 RepID=UPI002FEE8F7B